MNASPPTPALTSSRALRLLFDYYATSLGTKQDRFLTPADFARLLADTHADVVAAAPPVTSTSPGVRLYSSLQLSTLSASACEARDAQYALLFKVADRSASGRLSFNDFVLFENLLAKPDAEYDIAFKLFDRNGNGKLTFNDFKLLLQNNFASQQLLSSTHTTSADTQSSTSASVPIDFNSDWFKLIVGSDPVLAEQRELKYEEFTQLLKGLQSERLRQEFHYYDKDGDGAIDADSFKRIMAHIAKHKLSDDVVKQLPTLANVYPGKKITFGNVAAFYNVLRNMDLVEQVLRVAVNASSDGRITRADFLNTSSRLLRFSLFTPMEADVLFHFASLGADSKAGGRLSMSDFAKLLDPSFGVERTHKQDINALAATTSTDSKLKSNTHHIPSISASQQIMKGAYNFALGSIAGALGAFSIYPIDLVKTRMQNQRSAVVGEMLYRNSFDCFRKVIRTEGFFGLYSGLGPQLIGVAPEKAIKLTMNDLVRTLVTDQDSGTIPLWGEILAGCTAGGSQVIFTNPLEIVKIRLQVQGEVKPMSHTITTNVNGEASNTASTTASHSSTHHATSSATTTTSAATAAVTPQRRSALQIIRSLGLVGLYKGAAACLMRDIPFSAIYFTVYAHLKRDVFQEQLQPGGKLSIGQLLMAGAAAGMPAAYLTTPADVIKTRLQVEARKGQTTYSGIADAATKIYREEGMRAFFKGGPARIFRSSPQFGVTLMTYELLQRAMPLPWVTTTGDASGSYDKSNENNSNLPLYHRLGISATELAKIDNTFIKSRNAIRILQDVDYKFGWVSPSVAAERRK